MKLIINISETDYNTYKHFGDKGSYTERIIANGTPYDKVIDEVTELLENEWGYEGMKDDVARIMRGDV